MSVHCHNIGTLLFQVHNTHSLLMAPQDIYLLGGHDGAKWLDSMHQYTPAYECVTEVGLMPFARGYGGAAVIGRSIFMIGGGDGSSWLKTAVRYDIDSKEWFQVRSKQLLQSLLSLRSEADWPEFMTLILCCGTIHSNLTMTAAASVPADCFCQHGALLTLRNMQLETSKIQGFDDARAREQGCSVHVVIPSTSGKLVNGISSGPWCSWRTWRRCVALWRWQRWTAWSMRWAAASLGSTMTPPRSST